MSNFSKCEYTLIGQKVKPKMANINENHHTVIPKRCDAPHGCGERG